METTLYYPEPIQITTPQPWQWHVLATAFWNDPGFRFYFGERRTEKNYRQFMEAIVKGTLESGGSIFANPDKSAVIVWRWHGAELPEDRKQQMFDALGPEGSKRYLWIRQAADMTIPPGERKHTMQPNYVGVLPDMQCKGYGSYLIKWTLNHFDKLGFTTPFLVASTPRSAKLYGPLIGFHVDYKVPLGENNPEFILVMKRNGGGRPWKT